MRPQAAVGLMKLSLLHRLILVQRSRSQPFVGRDDMDSEIKGSARHDDVDKVATTAKPLALT